MQVYAWTVFPLSLFWDLVIEIFHSVPNKIEQPKEELGRNPLQATKLNMHYPIQCKHTNVVPTDIDHIPSNTIHSGAGAMLYVFEDNEETWKTQNQHQMDFLKVKHLYQEARTRPRSHTAQQKPSSYLLMQVYTWMEYLLLIFGIWL